MIVLVNVRTTVVLLRVSRPCLLVCGCVLVRGTLP